MKVEIGLLEETWKPWNESNGMMDRRLNADAVFAFQLRNPVHNGHALLMQVNIKTVVIEYRNGIK